MPFYMILPRKKQAVRDLLHPGNLEKYIAPLKGFKHTLSKDVYFTNALLDFEITLNHSVSF